MRKIGPKVLVVDDDPAFLSALMLCLNSLGCDTFSAADGIQALEVISKETISLVISDVQMPNLNGVGLLEAINQKGYDIPVIVVTGYSDYTDEDIDKRNGVVLLKKPFSRKQIREMIEMYIPFLAAPVSDTGS